MRLSLGEITIRIITATQASPEGPTASHQSKGNQFKTVVTKQKENTIMEDLGVIMLHCFSQFFVERIISIEELNMKNL